MLELPDNGISRSVDEHNGSLEAFCDWIEGCLLFDIEELSSTDIVDVLIGGEVYAKQDFALEWVTIALAEMRCRQAWMGTEASFKVERHTIKRIKSWEENPAHAFCITLSYAEWYPKWASDLGTNYTEQGELFEKFVKESVVSLFPGWKVISTGWTPSSPVNIKGIIEIVASHLKGIPGNIEQYVTGQENELGLDLLCYRPFDNNLASILICFMQCASGKNWEDKLHTPDLEMWKKLVDSPSEPRKAFAIPFALPEDKMKRIAPRVRGLFLDRYRLLSSSHDKVDWLSGDLEAELVEWLSPRIKALPL
jgi:hypothetical protein